MFMSFFFFFFFQAEDGIRDYKVTGVQTCALPISAEAADRAVSLLRRVRRSPPHGGGRCRERPTVRHVVRSRRRPRLALDHAGLAGGAPVRTRDPRAVGPGTRRSSLAEGSPRTSRAGSDAGLAGAPFSARRRGGHPRGRRRSDS